MSGFEGVWALAGMVAGAAAYAGWFSFRKRREQRDKRLHRLALQQLKRIDAMDGYAFEGYLGKLFTDLGYRTIVTKSSGDYGADVVLKRRGRVIVVQAKRYSKPVGLTAVQEVHSAVSHYGASEGWVVANTTYTKQAERLAATTGVRLINRNDLLQLIIEAKQ